MGTNQLFIGPKMDVAIANCPFKFPFQNMDNNKEQAHHLVEEMVVICTEMTSDEVNFVKWNMYRYID
jgi:hypothetical protein